MLKGRQYVERGLWVIGLVLISCATSEWIVVQGAEMAARQDGATARATPSNAKQGRDYGRLTCAPIGLTVPITDGYDTANLLHGVGHIPGSAVAGGLGNMVLAGHRDTYFRSLRRIRPGMTLQVESASGHFVYMVDRTEIVAPSEVRVTAIGEQPEMTLITCYPFDYLGAAPMRFIVHAHLASDPG